MNEPLGIRIHQAAHDNDGSSLRLLLANHPEAVGIENVHGEAPLVTAAVEGSTNCVKLLLENGADPCHQEGFALTCACYHGHAAIVQALLEAGADAVVQEVPRWHGLHAACGWGDGSRPNAEIVKMLLDVGANAKRVFQGRTPLQYAKAAGHTDIVSVLQQHTKHRF